MLKADLHSSIRRRGLKVTPTRLKILNFLGKSKRPLATKEILVGIGAARGHKRFDTVTFYRNLALFESTGLISAIQLKDGSRAFELNLGSHPLHHHHFVCEKCDSIEHLDFCGLEVPTRRLQKMGYKNIHHRLEFFGTCRSCAKRNGVPKK